MKCLFCHRQRIVNSGYPSTMFNGKKFDYVRCEDCALVFVHPIPDEGDYMQMYPASYQYSLDKTLPADAFEKLPGLRFSYGHKIGLIRRFGNTNPSVLEYGCGNGSFLNFLLAQQFQVTGVEFNPGYIQELKATFPKASFYAVEEVLGGQVAEKFDVIHLSNVLEHIADPDAVLEKLKSLLTVNGVFLIEGPLEENFTVAQYVRKVYSTKIRRFFKGNFAEHIPYHIFFSNAKNQLALFERVGLKKLHYEIKEESWPFPEKWKDSKSAIRKLLFLIGKISLNVSKLKKQFGNTFIYVGK